MSKKYMYEPAFSLKEDIKIYFADPINKRCGLI